MGGRRRLPGLAGSLVIDELIAYLRERIAEEEALALAAQVSDPAPWATPYLAGRLLDGQGVLVAEVTDSAAAHMIRWDPARVLAECAAKRAILDLDAKVRDWTERGAGARPAMRPRS